jgi:cell division septum initiation protein DivIVA
VSFETGNEQPDAETLIRRVHEIINNARTFPMSSSAKLDNKEEVLELLQEALDRYPEELREARHMLRERQAYLDKVAREGDEILDAARVQAERMVQRQEIVREAQAYAKKTVEDAREESRRLRHEAEDYCDQKLGSFEVVLDRTIKTVQAGREKLRITPLATPGAGPEGTDSLLGADGADDAFFDQDTT